MHTPNPMSVEAIVAARDLAIECVEALQALGGWFRDGAWWNAADLDPEYAMTDAEAMAEAETVSIELENLRRNWRAHVDKDTCRGLRMIGEKCGTVYTLGAAQFASAFDLTAAWTEAVCKHCHYCWPPQSEQWTPTQQHKSLIADFRAMPWVDEVDELIESLRREAIGAMNPELTRVMPTAAASPPTGSNAVRNPSRPEYPLAVAKMLNMDKRTLLKSVRCTPVVAKSKKYIFDLDDIARFNHDAAKKLRPDHT